MQSRRVIQNASAMRSNAARALGAQTTSPVPVSLRRTVSRSEGGNQGLAMRYAVAAVSADLTKCDGQNLSSMLNGTVITIKATSTAPNMLASIIADIVTAAST